MILTANTTQIQFGSLKSLCRNIENIQMDKDVKMSIAVFEKARKLPSIHITYRDITSYNGSSTIPPIDKLLAELRGYLVPPSSSSKPIIVKGQYLISDTPPLNPGLGDIWISRT